MHFLPFEQKMCYEKTRSLRVFLQIACLNNTVKLGKKEQYDKEQVGIKEPFPVTNLHLLHKNKEQF